MRRSSTPRRLKSARRRSRALRRLTKRPRRCACSVARSPGDYRPVLHDADERPRQAEDKARKHYEKVKAKYDEALKDLKEAEAELNEKVNERQALAQQHRLAEMRVSEQIQAKQVHDVSPDSGTGANTHAATLADFVRTRHIRPRVSRPLRRVPPLDFEALISQTTDTTGGFAFSPVYTLPL